LGAIAIDRSDARRLRYREATRDPSSPFKRISRIGLGETIAREAFVGIARKTRYSSA
jgi:hypothetical protein